MMDEGLLSICPACCDKLVKMLLALEPYGLFGSNFAHLSILYSKVLSTWNSVYFYKCKLQNEISYYLRHFCRLRMSFVISNPIFIGQGRINL